MSSVFRSLSVFLDRYQCLFWQKNSFRVITIMPAVCVCSVFVQNKPYYCTHDIIDLDERNISKTSKNRITLQQFIFHVQVRNALFRMFNADNADGRRVPHISSSGKLFSSTTCSRSDIDSRIYIFYLFSVSGHVVVVLLLFA